MSRHLGLSAVRCPLSFHLMFGRRDIFLAASLATATMAYGFALAGTRADRIRETISKTLGSNAPIVARWSQEYNVDPCLVAAVVQIESAGDCNSVSRDGAMGLMQLMPETCADFGVDNPYDPDQNVRGGTALLAKDLRRYHGSFRKALAAYNAGPRRVDDGSWTSRSETRRYVPAVLAIYHALHDSGVEIDSLSEGEVTLPSAPQAGHPLDEMMQALAQSSQVVENGALDNAAQTIIGEIIQGQITEAGGQKRLVGLLANSPLGSTHLNVVFLRTADASGFTAAWQAQNGPASPLVGIAHLASGNGHCWLVVGSNP